MVAALIILSFAVLVQTAVLFQLLKQNGRILLRLDSIERAIPGSSAQTESVRRGLGLGTPVSDFQLRDLAGNNVTRASF
jgi:hypothetical protein